MPENFYKILNTHRSLSSGDTSALPYFATLETGYIFNFGYTPDSSSIVIRLVFSESAGWFAIGFGSSMSDADMIVCIPGSGTISCSDYYSTSQTTPSMDTTLGGTDDITLLGYDMSSGTTTVKIQRKLDTGDTYDKAIVQGPNSMIWAYSPSTTFIQHSSKSGGTVDLTPTSQSSNSSMMAKVVITIEEDPLEKTHGLLIFFGWGVAIDVGLIFMALGRKYPIYVLLHSLTMWYTVISSLITEAIMISKRGRRN